MMYQVLFKSPENRLIKDWISVENITSETKSRENQKKSESLANEKKRIKRLHKKKYCIHKPAAQIRSDERKIPKTTSAYRERSF